MQLKLVIKMTTHTHTHTVAYGELHVTRKVIPRYVITRLSLRCHNKVSRKVKKKKNWGLVADLEKRLDSSNLDTDVSFFATHARTHNSFFLLGLSVISPVTNGNAYTCCKGIHRSASQYVDDDKKGGGYLMAMCIWKRKKKKKEEEDRREQWMEMMIKSRPPFFFLSVKETVIIRDYASLIC